MHVPVEDRSKSVQIKICITTRDGNQVMGNDFCKEMEFRPGEGRISRDNNKFLLKISKACCITIYCKTFWLLLHLPCTILQNMNGDLSTVSNIPFLVSLSAK